MPSTERITHKHPELESEGLRSTAFSINYATRADTDKGIPGRNLSLNIREGSFSLKPELDGPLHALCDSLQIPVPHCEDDIPNFVISCLYTVDEATGQEKPHFENEVIPVLFPEGDSAAHKVKKFLSTAQAPDKSDQCCEIKGMMHGREESIHLHGPYQAENKTRLTLLALVGYEPAQQLLAKLVEAQPELGGKPAEQTAVALASAIVDRKREQAAEHHHHDHNHEEHEEHDEHEEHHSLSEKIGSIINKGKFKDHPEVAKWWVNQNEDVLTATYASLKKNILQAEQPAKPLSDCGDVNFPDTNSPLHFHSGIADWQKRRLLEVVAVWNATPQEERTRETERIYQRAIAVVSVYFKGHADFEPLERELREANDEKSIADVLKRMGTTAINTVNTLFPDKQIVIGHHEHEENHEKVEKLNWDDRLKTATKVIVSSALHAEDPRMQESFKKIAGKGFLGKIDVAEQLPDALVKQNTELTAQFIDTLKAARAANPDLDVKALIVKLAQIHDPSITDAHLDNFQEKNIQFTNQDAIKILALHLEILSRPEGMEVSPEQLAKEQNIHDLVKQLQSKGINFVNINADHSTAYHMELRPMLDKDGKPVMQMDLCPHSEQADQLLTETMQQVQQVEQVIQREVQMQQNLLNPIPQPPLDRLYPPPFFAGANHNHLRGPFPPPSYMGNPYGVSQGGFSSFNSSPSGIRSEGTGSNGNRNGGNQNSHGSERESHSNNNHANDGSRESSKPRAAEQSSAQRVISFDPPRPTQAEPARKVLVHEVSSGGKSPSVLESIATTKRPKDASGKVFITRESDHSSQPTLTLLREVTGGGTERSSINSPTTTTPERDSRVAYVNRADSAPLTILRDVPSGGIDRPAFRAIPVTTEPAQAARVADINNPDSGPLTFIQPVRAGGKPKESVASVRKTSNASQAARTEYVNDDSSERNRVFVQSVRSGGKSKESVVRVRRTASSRQAARTEYVNDGVARTFVRKVNSGGVDSSSVSPSKTDNPSEATSVSYVNSGPSKDNGPSNSGKSTPQPVPTFELSRSESSQRARTTDSQPASNSSNQSFEPSTPRFTTSTIDTGPKNPSPTKPNPNRSLNSGETVSTPISKPAKAPNIVIGTNLTKAFKQVQEKATAATTQVAQKTEQVAETVQTTQNKQQEQVATALGVTRQEKTKQNVSKKVEAGESFGTSASNEGVAQSTTAQANKEKTEATTPAATQSRQSRGSSNVTEAARITEVETPKGKVKIIEGGRTTSVSGNAPQRTQSVSGSTEEEAVVASVAGTDEQHEENQTSDTQAPAQKQTTAPVAATNNKVKIKQSGQTAAASLSLSVNNEYLDFTNPHGIGDAFKQAWSQALAA